ncbi:unnamed protein product, partial [Discosporangium mesarthrocarpum]
MHTSHRHLIHRDVKPANFVLGPGRGCQTVFCIDFGLSTRYRHPRTLQHIPYRDGRSLTGTPRYASINNHLGVEQSRRDDLESIGYVLVYFLKGSLPWQGLKARNAKRKYKMILERKQAISIQQLCQGLPQQFAEYLAYCRSLKFEAKPNISYLQGLLRELYKSQGYSSSGPIEWDWTKYEINSPTSGGVSNAGGKSQNYQDSPAKATLPHSTEAIPSNPVQGGEGRLSMDFQGKNENGGQLDQRWGNGSIAPRQHILGYRSPPPPLPRVSPAYDKEDRRVNSKMDIVGDRIGNSGNEKGASPAQTRGGTGMAGASQGQASGGWSMWNLRPKTSGSFWGGGVRAWNPRDSGEGGKPFEEGVATPNGTSVERRDSAMLKLGVGGAVSGSGASGIGGAGESGGGHARPGRPHTAHGLRSAEAGEGQAGGGAAAAPVVAGARGMMRYRNERTGAPCTGGGSAAPGLEANTGGGGGRGSGGVSGSGGGQHAWS